MNICENNYWSIIKNVNVSNFNDYKNILYVVQLPVQNNSEQC